MDITRQDLDNSDVEEEKLESGDIGGSYYKANQESRQSHNIDNELYEDDIVSNNPNSSVVHSKHQSRCPTEEAKDILDLPFINQQNSFDS